MEQVVKILSKESHTELMDRLRVEIADAGKDGCRLEASTVVEWNASMQAIGMLLVFSREARKWECDALASPFPPDLKKLQLLDKRGADGWEAMPATNYLLLRRPKPQ